MKFRLRLLQIELSQLFNLEELANGGQDTELLHVSIT